MTKAKKIKTGILAIALLLSGNLMSLAQSGRASAPSAIEDLNNYKADPNNPQLSELQFTLLQSKAELEAGQKSNTLSEDELVNLSRKISTLENRIQMIGNSEVMNKESNPDVVFKNYSQTGQLNRAQFMLLNEAQQKAVMLNLSSATITDLVNESASNLRVALDNVFYIPVNNFYGYDISKQIYILNNPSTYILVQESTKISEINATKEIPASDKIRITTAEYNTFSPERKRAVDTSNHLEINDEPATIAAPTPLQPIAAPAVYRMTRAEFNTFSIEKQKAIEQSTEIIIID